MTNISMVFTYFILLSSLFHAACSTDNQDATDDPATVEATENLNLPAGFAIETFAKVPNARSMAKSPSGTIFVGSRSGGTVYALQDIDGDGKAENKFLIAEKLNNPNGVAFKDGDLFVAEITRIIVFRDIEANLKSPPKFEVIYDQYPDEHHGWKYIAFGPDDKLYIPVGAPCNICKSDEIFASITRMNPDGSDLEIVAHGVRNTVGFDWQPTTGKLWFTDNGRDHMGDNFPPCELNVLDEVGQHFGYPYCHGGDIADPEFGAERHCNEFVKPKVKFKAHTAPLGMKFYRGDMLPDSYKGDVFVAQHGSWNRSSKIGYRIMHVEMSDGKVGKTSVFIDGWLDSSTQSVTGRPVDILELKDGSLLISDDYAGEIYRLTYKQ